MNYAKKDQILSDFDKLINYYAWHNRKYFDDIKGNLLLFLLELISAEKCISNRFVAVCLRNEYFKISKQICIYQTEREYTEFCRKNNFGTYFENEILFAESLKKMLNIEQQELIKLRFWDNLSCEEIAKKKCISRQAVHKMQKRALDKLKPII